MSVRPEYFRLDNLNGGEMAVRLETCVENGYEVFIQNTDWSNGEKAEVILNKDQLLRLISVLEDFSTMCKEPGELPDDLLEE